MAMNTLEDVGYSAASNFDLNLKLIGVVIRVGRAAPLVRWGEPVSKIKTTRINFGASFRLLIPPKITHYTGVTDKCQRSSVSRKGLHTSFVG